MKHPHLSNVNLGAASRATATASGGQGDHGFQCTSDDGGAEEIPAIPRHHLSKTRSILTPARLLNAFILCSVIIAAISAVPTAAALSLNKPPVSANADILYVQGKALEQVLSKDATAISLPVTPTTTEVRRHPWYRRQSTTDTAAAVASTCACSSDEGEEHNGAYYAGIVLIPGLVLLSGIFAGLTLGYMSLDMNQLQVLAKTGTPKQQRDAKRIIPLRKNGHLLLVSLLIGNMAASETLPVVADPVLGGGLQAVIVSTVLVIIFAEIIPQSVCSRFGLQIGAFMVWPTRVIIGITFIVSWPVSKLLEFLLGAHSGVVYRRAELKELISMHGEAHQHGGDLNKDTITIVGATLDLQEKVVSDAMTGLDKAFMLDVNTRLDYATLTRIVKSGHSRIPVYEERESPQEDASGQSTVKPVPRKRIIGALLTKQLILLDPEDAVPLRDLPMNPMPTVSENMALLQILNTFQEGRSHIAMVARSPPRPPKVERSASHSSSSSTASSNEGSHHRGRLRFASRVKKTLTRTSTAGVTSSSSPSSDHRGVRNLFKRDDKTRRTDEEQPSSPDMADGEHAQASETAVSDEEIEMTTIPDPDDVVGLITLEDVLEELIGEEIEDEFDAQLTGKSAAEPYIPAEARYHINNTSGARRGAAGILGPLTRSKADPTTHPSGGLLSAAAGQIQVSDTPVSQGSHGGQQTNSAQSKPGPLAALRRSTFGLGRSSSAPGRNRANPEALTTAPIRKDAAPAIATGANTEKSVAEKREKSAPEPMQSAEKTSSSITPVPQISVDTDYFSPPKVEQTAMVTSPGHLTASPAGESPSHGSAGIKNTEVGQQTDTSNVAMFARVVDQSENGAVERQDDNLATGAVEAPQPVTEAPSARRARSVASTTLLSDALLLERGRRQLRAQGQDPDAVNLLVATRAVTPGRGNLGPPGQAVGHLRGIASGSTTPSTPRLETPDGGAILVVQAPGQRAQTPGAVQTTAAAHAGSSSAFAAASANNPIVNANLRKLSFKSPSPSIDSLPHRVAQTAVTTRAGQGSRTSTPLDDADVQEVPEPSAPKPGDNTKPSG